MHHRSLMHRLIPIRAYYGVSAHHNIISGYPVRWLLMGRQRREIPRGVQRRFFYSHLPRVLFYVAFRETHEFPNCAVHNTMLITLHNAIIAVVVFVAARVAYHTI